MWTFPSKQSLPARKHFVGVRAVLAGFISWSCGILVGWKVVQPPFLGFSGTELPSPGSLATWVPALQIQLCLPLVRYVEFQLTSVLKIRPAGPWQKKRQTCPNSCYKLVLAAVSFSPQLQFSWVISSHYEANLLSSLLVSFCFSFLFKLMNTLVQGGISFSQAPIKTVNLAGKHRGSLF